MSAGTLHFETKEIKVTYDPKLCQHAGICCQGLPEVFKSDVLPWVDLDAASQEKIEAQVKKCPTGALELTHKQKLELV